jgi:hypothetical protein
MSGVDGNAASTKLRQLRKIGLAQLNRLSGRAVVRHGSNCVKSNY